jgi:PHD/YefM family antitoxin component YafN of YafNO toxin-antitoxin module
MNIIAAGAAREQLPSILDNAEKGETTMILRHSKPSAAVIPASEIETFHFFQQMMREVGETLELSRDPEVIAAVKRAQHQINHGEIVWDDEGP